MAGFIGHLRTLISADSSKAVKGITTFQGALKSLYTKTTGVKTAIVGFGTAIVSHAVVSKITDLTNASFELAGSLNDLKDRTGLSVDTLAELRYIGKLSGVEFEALANAIKKMNLNLAETAMTGKGSAADALKRLGLDPNKLAGSETAIDDIAEAISKIENPAEAAAMAADIFGQRAGPELLGLLMRGKSGIKELREEFHRLGGTMTQADADKLDQFNDSWDRLGTAVEGFGNQLALTVAPTLTGLTETITKMMTEWDEGDDLRQGMDDFVASCSVAFTLVQGLVNSFRTLRGLVYTPVRSNVPIFEQIGKLVDDHNKANGKITSYGDFFDAFGDSLNRRGMNDLTAHFGGIDGGSNSLTTFFDDVKKAAAEARAEIAKGNNELTDTQKAAIKATEKGLDLVDSLKLQRDHFGATSNEMKIFQLRADGAAESVLAQAEALNRQIEAMEKSRKATEDFTTKLSDILEGIESPEQKLAKRLDELKRFEPFMTEADFAEATFKAHMDTIGINDIFDEREAPERGLFFAEALEAGTHEARLATERHRSGFDRDGKPLEAIAKETKRGADAARETTSELRELNRNMKFSAVDLRTPAA